MFEATISIKNVYHLREIFDFFIINYPEFEPKITSYEGIGISSYNDVISALYCGLPVGMSFQFSELKDFNLFKLVFG